MDADCGDVWLRRALVLTTRGSDWRWWRLLCGFVCPRVDRGGLMTFLGFPEERVVPTPHPTGDHSRTLTWKVLALEICGMACHANEHPHHSRFQHQEFVPCERELAVLGARCGTVMSLPELPQDSPASTLWSGVPHLKTQMSAMEPICLC